jgi:hypothetical protein
MDGKGMVNNVHELRPKVPETEKITINLGYVDRATIASVSVLGALHASPAVKAALADRMR